MSKLILNAVSGGSYYAILRGDNGGWWNTLNGELEAYNSANWDDYAIALAESGSSGAFEAEFPLNLPGGNWAVTYYRQEAASPAVGDPAVGSRGFEADRGIVFRPSSTFYLSEYGGRIWVDSSSINVGTTPLLDGTRSNPVADLATAMEIGTQLGIFDFQLLPGGHVFPAGLIADGKPVRIIGSGDAVTELDLGTGGDFRGVADVRGIEFLDLRLGGYPSVDLPNVLVTTRCQVDVGAPFDSEEGSRLIARECSFPSQALRVPGVDIDGSTGDGQVILRGLTDSNYLRDWRGIVQFQDITSARVYLTMLGGQVRLLSTCGPGTILELRGFGELIDESAGADIRKQGWIEAPFLDASVSSRLAAAGYTAPDNATLSSAASNVAAIKTKVDTNLDAAVSSRLSGTSYTAGENAAIQSREAISAKTEKLTFNASNQVIAHAQNMRGTDNALLASNYTAPANSTIGSISANVAAVKSTVDMNLDAKVSTRLATAGYTAPANSTISTIAAAAAAIQAKTDAHLDAAISSRLATAGYTAPDNATLSTASANVAAVKVTVDANLDAAISSRLPTSGYTAPDNTAIGTTSAGVGALMTLFAELTEDDGEGSNRFTAKALEEVSVSSDVAAIVEAVGDVWALLETNLDAAISSRLATAGYTAPDNATLSTAAANVAAVKVTVDTNLDAAVSSRLAASGYTAPDNATIGTISTAAAAIQAKTDAHLDAAISSRLATAGYTAPDNTAIGTTANLVGLIADLLAELTEDDGQGNDRFTAKALELVSAATIATAVAGKFKFNTGGDVLAESTNMRGTDDALLAESYVEPDNEGIGLTTSAVGDIASFLADRVDAKISTRLAASGYTAPDNATIGTISTALAAVKVTVDANLDAQVSTRSSHGVGDILRARAANFLTGADPLSLAAWICAGLNSEATAEALIVKDGNGDPWRSYPISTSPPGEMVTGVSES